MYKAVFTKDLANKRVTVERTFDAPRSRVWEAWTRQELLEKWWAPLPWRAVTKSFEFIEGGHWHYYMAGPQGEQEWCYIGYDSIDPEHSFSASDYFCDENMNVRVELPQMHWRNEFTDEGEKTTVVVTTSFASVADMEKLTEMGFEAGFTQGLDQLEALLGN